MGAQLFFKFYFQRRRRRFHKKTKNDVIFELKKKEERKEPKRIMSDEEERLKNAAMGIPLPRTPEPTDLLAQCLDSFLTTLTNIMANQKTNVRFNDVESSYKKFYGHRHISIESWLSHFLEQSRIFNLNEFEKYIFAKRLMHGVWRSKTIC